VKNPSLNRIYGEKLSAGSKRFFLRAHALDKRGEKVNNAIQKKNHEVTGR